MEFGTGAVKGSGLPRFDGADYKSYAFYTKAYLREKGLWPVVKADPVMAPTTDEQKLAWRKDMEQHWASC